MLLVWPRRRCQRCDLGGRLVGFRGGGVSLGGGRSLGRRRRGVGRGICKGKASATGFVTATMTTTTGTMIKNNNNASMTTAMSDQRKRKTDALTWAGWRWLAGLCGRLGWPHDVNQDPRATEKRRRKKDVDAWWYVRGVWATADRRYFDVVRRLLGGRVREFGRRGA